LENPVARLRLAEFEQKFLELKKCFRYLDQNRSEITNFCFKGIVKGERLTANQRRITKKWVAANYPAFETEGQALFRKHLEGKALEENTLREAFRIIDELEVRFIERGRKETLGNFRERSKAKIDIARKTANNGNKSGTRAERMAAHQPKEKTKTEKTMELIRGERFGSQNGKQFNSIEYVLNETKKGNKIAAARFDSLLKRGILSENSLRRLYVNGILCQKVFLKVLSDPEFQKKFGNQMANLLANGLAFIGSVGKQIVNAKKAFQGTKGRQMFDFLERKHFIDTKHGMGNRVVYIARF